MVVQAQIQPAIFNKVFNQYNFSIILNLFDNSIPKRLTHAYHTSKMCEQNASLVFGKARTIGVKSLNKICPEMVRKALK